MPAIVEPVVGMFGSPVCSVPSPLPPPGLFSPRAAKEAADAIDDVADDRDITDAAAEEVVEEVADLFKEITKVFESAAAAATDLGEADQRS